MVTAPELSSDMRAKRLMAAIPAPPATASFTASHDAKASVLTGCKPICHRAA